MPPNKLLGQFTNATKFAEIMKEKLALSEEIYKSTLPDNVAKFEVDLSTARSEKKLSDIGGGERKFRHANWYYLKVLIKGDGTWTLKFVLKDKSTVSLSNAEVTKGDEIYLEFTELEFTNLEQSEVTSPTFWIERRELS